MIMPVLTAVMEVTTVRKKDSTNRSVLVVASSTESETEVDYPNIISIGLAPEAFSYRCCLSMFALIFFLVEIQI